MGTYAVTHIKKDNKIIALSDSYDGYMPGMGLSTLKSIKYIDDQTLAKLFDNYTASKKVSVETAMQQVDDDGLENDDEVQASQRLIENTIFQLKEDSNNNPQAIEWITSALSSDISTSVTGFGPLLYLNINPHYGRNYDYCDYLIDLDKKEFSFSLDSGAFYTLSFDKIRQATEDHLIYFANADTSLGNITELLKPYETLDDIYYAIQEVKNNTADTDLSTQSEEETNALKEKSQTIVDAYFNLPAQDVQNFYTVQKQAHEAYLTNSHSNILQQDIVSNIKDNINDEDIDNEMYGYSVRNNQNISPNQLILMTTFLQKMVKLNPNCDFLIKNADWGMNEDQKNGGIRFFSSMNNNPFEQSAYNHVMNTIEQTFKIRFSIFSSSGTWKNDGSTQSNEDSLFGFDSIQGPIKSLFTLNEIQNTDDLHPAIEYIDPFLANHLPYDELRTLLLNNKESKELPYASLIWTFSAILHHDQELFELVYPMVKEGISTITDSAQVNKIKNLLLNTLSDAELINSTLASLAEPLLLSKDLLKKEQLAFEQFVAHLHNTSFFNDVSQQMNQAETTKFKM